MAFSRNHEKITHDDMNFRCVSVAARGTVVCYNANDGEVAKVNTLASKPAGVLLESVVAGLHPSNIVLGDDTGTINVARNFNKNQTYVSGVVRLLKIGEMVTNATSGTINCGDVLKMGPGGIVATAGGGTIGHALSDKDADGYVKIWVNIV